MDINKHYDYKDLFFILTDVQGEMTSLLTGTQPDEILQLISISMKAMRDCEEVVLDLNEELVEQMWEALQAPGCPFDFEARLTWKADPDETDTLPFKIERAVPWSMDRI